MAKQSFYVCNSTRFDLIGDAFPVCPVEEVGQGDAVVFGCDDGQHEEGKDDRKSDDARVFAWWKCTDRFCVSF
jgi:hypothetical protein